MSFDRRISYVNSNDTSDEGSDEETYYPNEQVRGKAIHSGKSVSNFNFQNEKAANHSQTHLKRKPTSFSKNALIARENRLRKKMYVSKLEDNVTSLKKDNKKLGLIIDQQSSVISELRREVKYLKSVISNSSDISRLIRNIHQSSGMSVSSSLDTKLTLNNCYVPKPKQLTVNPLEVLEDQNVANTLPENYSLLNETSENFEAELFKELDIPITLPNQELLEGYLLNQDQVTCCSDHNYTLSNEEDQSDDVGVCLHISKHHVSLEFCATCNETACQTWVG